MPINPIFDRLLALLTTGNKKIDQIGLRPRPNPTKVVFMLSDGTDDELDLSEHKAEEIDYWFVQTKRLWEYISKIRIPE